MHVMERDRMRHVSAVPFGIIIVMIMLFAGTTSAATIFPALNPDFSFKKASFGSDDSLSVFFSSTGSPVSGAIVWSAYNTRQKESIAATDAEVLR